MSRLVLVAVYGLLMQLFMLGVTPALAGEMVFKEHASYEAADNFSSNDLLQGLQPDQATGLWPAGTLLDGPFASDAESSDSPGQVAPILNSVVWTAAPAYLIYTLPQPCDITEIRISATLSDGPDDEKENLAGALGDLALGINMKTNPGGRPPIRPTENAIEVMFQGNTLWTPIVSGRVFSGRRTLPQSFWQGTIRLDDQPLLNVVRMKFVLDRTVVWSSGNYGQLTRISEIDVMGQPSRSSHPPTSRLISPSDEALAYRGFVFPYDSNAMWFKWSGTGFRARFRSSQCRLRFNGANNSHYWIKIDGADFKQFPLKPIIDLTALLDPDKAEHDIEILKQNELDHGRELFMGLELDRDAALLPVTPRARKLLFLGDSITVGMGAGLEGETDFLRSYAYLLGETFQADIRLVALSGLGVHYGWRSYTFMQEWELVVSSLTQFDHDQNCSARWQPDCIIVNLSTNDASRSVSEPDCISAMKTLVGVMRGYYPNATIAVMVPWTYGCYREPLKKMVADLSRNGMWNLHFIDAGPADWVTEDGMRDNTHPNFRGQAFAAELLAQSITTIMNWPINDSDQ